MDSVHIISHGGSGHVHLGNTALGSDNIEQYKSQLEKWQTSLAPEADIMLYGCDVAAGTGANFVERFSQLTGADVAASTNTTGRGGDWNLEFAKGQIESPLALQPEAMAAYQGDLATIVVANNSDSGPGFFKICDRHGCCRRYNYLRSRFSQPNHHPHQRSTRYSRWQKHHH